MIFFLIIKVNIDEKWILSIDGGGIRGLIPALILQQLEEDVTNQRGGIDTRIADMFDMVSGNSTGSIISLGLTVSDGANPPRPMYPASELVKLYKEKRKDIFGKVSIWSWFKVTNLLYKAPNNEVAAAVDVFDSAYFRANTEIEEGGDENGYFGPAYSPKGLENLLKEKFADKSLKDTLKDVLVPSYNITEKKDVYFTNYSDVTNSYKIRDVIRASTAAPTYFEAKKIDESYYIDGGIFMNNPAYKAYLEVKNKFSHLPEFSPSDKQVKKQKIVVCSLGTGFFQDKLDYLHDSGEVRWVSPLISLMMNVSSNLVGDYLENLQQRDEIKYYRLQTNLKNDIPLDDTSDRTLEEFENLANAIINGEEYKDLVKHIVNHLKTRN
jgi:patatin-like phospholipase/acyl hydrolase